MWKGEVISIFIRPEESQPTQEVSQVRAVPGKGLEGDYFFSLNADHNNRQDSGKEITLIEIEALEAVNREYGVAISLGESRRNIITRHVPLNHLVGKQFRIGEVSLLGLRLCEPCSHLAKLTQKQVLPSLVHRGGLRAKILEGGTIQTGDSVLLNESSIDKEVSDE
jgi:MOSC domain-containing protein YiiM